MNVGVRASDGQRSSGFSPGLGSTVLAIFFGGMSLAGLDYWVLEILW